MHQKLRKSGNSYVVTIPREEVERRGLHEGQLLAVEVTPLELRPVLNPEIRGIIDTRWERNKAAYRYLADH